MSSPLNLRLTREEILAFERRSEERHEYIDGELFAMNGASRRHNQIVVNLSREISLQFKGRPCTVYTNDMRVRIAGNERYTYPDVVALCETPAFEDKEQDCLINPVLIIEVLQRRATVEDYRHIETFAEYVLIDPTKPHIEQFRKQSSGLWLFSATSGIESTLDLSSINCRVLLAEIYDKVEFGPELEPSIPKTRP